MLDKSRFWSKRIGPLVIAYGVGLVNGHTPIPPQIIALLDELTSRWHYVFEIAIPAGIFCFVVMLGCVFPFTRASSWWRRLRIKAMDDVTGVAYSFATFVAVGSFGLWAMQHDLRLLVLAVQVEMVCFFLAALTGAYREGLGEAPHEAA